MNITLNLLPWRAQRRRRRWRNSLLALALALLAGGMAWWWLEMRATRHLDAQRQQHQHMQRQLEELNARIEAHARHAEQQRVRALVRARLAQERYSFVRLLEVLSRQMPEGVTLTDVRQDGDTLTLNARAVSSAQIARSVQQWNRAGAVMLSTIHAERQRGAGYAFSLSVPWPGSEHHEPVQQLAQTEPSP